jgi:hypothetical protein
MWRDFLRRIRSWANVEFQYGGALEITLLLFPALGWISRSWSKFFGTDGRVAGSSRPRVARARWASTMSESMAA